MRLPARDRVATLYVAIAVVAYAGWLIWGDTANDTSVRIMTAAVLGLGFVASATAVVPAFNELLHAAKIYLVTATVLGLIAFGAGVLALVWADPAYLVILIGVTVVLWLMATARHLASARRPSAPVPINPPRRPAIRVRSLQHIPSELEVRDDHEHDGQARHS